MFIWDWVLIALGGWYSFGYLVLIAGTILVILTGFKTESR